MNITILTHDKQWKGLAPTVKRAVEAALNVPSPLGGEGRDEGANLRFSPMEVTLTPALSPEGRGSVTIVLTNDAEIKTLNHTYRKKNKPTNVLSFPNGEVENGVRQLGDIILAYETIAAEAKAQEKPLKNHITHLAVHGVLHLLGFDHENEKDAGIMEACEITILARMGIANPYESA